MTEPTKTVEAMPPLAERQTGVRPSISYTRIPYNSALGLWHPPVYGSAQVGDCMAVIDIEALVMKNFVLVEQIGFIIIDRFGRELFAKKFYIEQPLNERELSERYSFNAGALRAAINGYEWVTGDSYIHPKTRYTYTWSEACTVLHGIINQYRPIIWAKGAALERRVFGMYIINELEDFGCPKYPSERKHDPLEECWYFSQFIPGKV